MITIHNSLLTYLLEYYHDPTIVKKFLIQNDLDVFLRTICRKTKRRIMEAKIVKIPLIY